MTNNQDNAPFGPAPEEYNYRCSRCQCELWVNEAIIDVITRKLWNTQGSKIHPKRAKFPDWKSLVTVTMNDVHPQGDENN